MTAVPAERPPVEASAFEYAVLRVVPRVDRGEFVNGAVLLYCQSRGFLGVRVRADLSAVTALCPQADLATIQEALAALVVSVTGEGRDDADPGRRFRWMTAPRSAVLQPGPIHTGVTTDPDAELGRIAARMLEAGPAA